MVRLAAAVVALASIMSACSLLVGGNDQLVQQADAALARWAAAVDKAGDKGVVIAGELTGQVGDWEAGVGDNNKSALLAGMLEPAVALPTDQPAPGKVVWPNGTSQSVPLLSASEALARVVAESTDSCTECLPIEVTGASIGTASVETNGGPANAPVWLFALAGTNVKISRVAVANEISVVPPADSDFPAGISIESAVVGPDKRHLTVSFDGADLTGDKPCGSDYTAQVVESDLAVVVIVIEHRNPAIGACAGTGAIRTADVTLAAPLGDRAVLEVRQGLPVPVTAE